MRLTLLCAVLAAAACERMPRSSGRSDTAAVRPDSEAIAGPSSVPAPVAQPAAPPAPVATKVAIVVGFLTPASGLHDSPQAIYFVFNVYGGPTHNQNNVFISRVNPDGAADNHKV